MKIQLVSDLHLEFHDIDIKNTNNADVLILSGDICVADDFDRNIPAEGTQLISDRQASAIRYLKFFERISAEFPHVIYVAGNHEFYHGKWFKTLEIIKKVLSPFNNIHFLECNMFELGEVIFIGGTLWTDMNRSDPLTTYGITSMMNDFKIIRDESRGFSRLKPIDTVVRHNKMLNFIREVIEKNPNKKIVVVGHHAPARQSIHARYQNDYIMNGGYASDLSELILNHPQIVLWTHGHMHNSSDYMIGNTRIVCNPRGYPGENCISDFNPNLIMEV